MNTKPVMYRNSITVLMIICVIAACTPANPQSSPQESATSTLTQLTPTETEVPAYVVNDSTEAFTPAQETINQSTEVVLQKERIQRWLDYWVQFDNRPFALDSTDIHWKYIYDDPAEPQEAVVLIEVGGPDYQNKLFGVPMNEEGFVDFPPPVTDTSIQPSLGPLEINPNKDNTVLSADQGSLVRKEFNFKGDIVERLVAGHWEAESLIKGDIFQDPQSKAEFDTVVLAPSPIDDPENFTLFQEEYLKQVYEKLKIYTGPTISDEYTGIDYNTGRLVFISPEWPVISSYKFKFQNEELLTKTFVYMDKRNGELVPLSFTYPPEGSYFYQNLETPNENGKFVVSFLWADKVKQLLPNDSMDALLPDTLDEFHYNSLIRFIQNTATPEEKEATIKTMFVITGFHPRP